MTIENAAPTAITFAFRSNDAYAPLEPDTAEELFTASLVKRGVARVIDLGVAMVISVVAQFLVVSTLRQHGAFATVTGFFLGITLPYSLEAAMTGLGGQSVGKRIVKIRVVRNADGRAVGLARSFLRTYSPVALFLAASVVFALVGIDPLGFGLFGMAFQGVQLVFLWSERARDVADRIAGTRVVDVPSLGF